MQAGYFFSFIAGNKIVTHIHFIHRSWYSLVYFFLERNPKTFDRRQEAMITSSKPVYMWHI